MPIVRNWFPGLISLTKATVIALAGIVVGAGVTSYFNRGDSLELAIKQQELSGVQKVQSSGTSLDLSFRALNDALVDNRDVEVARQAMRAAIAQHSSDVFSLQPVFGADAHAYLERLAMLRSQVDASTNSIDAMPMAQTALYLIGERQRMISKATSKIGGQTTP